MKESKELLKNRINYYLERIIELQDITKRYREEKIHLYGYEKSIKWYEEKVKQTLEEIVKE